MALISCITICMSLWTSVILHQLYTTVFNNQTHPSQTGQKAKATHISEHLRHNTPHTPWTSPQPLSLTLCLSRMARQIMWPRNSLWTVHLRHWLQKKWPWCLRYKCTQTFIHKRLFSQIKQHSDKTRGMFTDGWQSIVREWPVQRPYTETISILNFTDCFSFYSKTLTYTCFF